MIRNVALTLIGLAFCALSAWLLILGDPADRLMAIGCLVFFGGCALIGAQSLAVNLRPAKELSAKTVFHFDFGFHLAFGVAAWGMTAGAVIFALQESWLWIVAAPALILFGLGGAALFARAFDRGPVITIDAAGFYDRRIFSRPIPWDAIEAIGFPWAGPAQCLQINGPDLQAYRRPRTGLAAWLGRGSFRDGAVLVAFQGLDGPLALALAAIGTHKPEILVLGDFDD